MSSAKMRWTTPQLIVLASGMPEESVLLHCKRIGATTGSPYSPRQEGCDYGEGHGVCGNCQSRSGS